MSAAIDIGAIVPMAYRVGHKLPEGLHGQIAKRMMAAVQGDKQQEANDRVLQEQVARRKKLRGTLLLLAEEGRLTTEDISQRGEITLMKARSQMKSLTRIGLARRAGQISYTRVWEITEAGREFAEVMR